ncbi:MAG: SEC-C metal-binding domain-containing protein [Oscillospiraceae bacterium]
MSGNMSRYMGLNEIYHYGMSKSCIFQKVSSFELNMMLGCDNMTEKGDGSESAMERNDLCFCGSGLKFKSCCADVYKSSILIDLGVKYQKLDASLKAAEESQDITYICNKGCSSCCSEYFYVSLLEYIYIKHSLLKNNPQLFASLCQKAKIQLERMKTYSKPEYDKLSSKSTDSSIFEDKLNISRFEPCIFLSVNGSCEVYQARPFICRLYGCTIEHNICEKIRHACTDAADNCFKFDLAKKHLTAFSTGGDFWQDIDYFRVNKKTKIVRPYPLFYWIANDEKYLHIYNTAVSSAKSEFVKNV